MAVAQSRRVHPARIVDRLYVTRGLVRTELPLDRLVDESFAQDANRALGPFRLAPAPTSKAGCGK